MTITDEQFNREHAEEICALGIGPSGPDVIFILDTTGEPAQELDKNMARALAVRLLALADDLPEPARILRRASEVNRRLIALDG